MLAFLYLILYDSNGNEVTQGMALDLKYICTFIGDLSGVPIRLFEGREQVLWHARTELPQDPMLPCWEEILSIRSHIGYFVTEHFNYYGIVNAGTQKIVLGPTCQVMNSDRELREMAFLAEVPPGDIADFVAGMKSIVRLPLDSVLQILCAVNYLLNGEKLGLENVLIFDSEQERLRALLQRQHSAQMEEGNLDADIWEDTHNTYAVEQKVLGMVNRGDTAALRAWIAAAPAVRGGTLAANQIRQLKNTFVVTATLVSRAALAGGMEQADAFVLSDAFIQKCELLHAIGPITNLQYRMVLEFAERVERLRFGSRGSRLALQVSNYIQHHLPGKITVQEIADALFLSRPYLSRKFKEDTGRSLTDFILSEKTEEAKRLLRYSDRSVCVIGSYLGFSSPGHFSRVFKKYAGCTPVEYRGKSGKVV